MRKFSIFLFFSLTLLATSCLKLKKQTYFQGELRDSSAIGFNNPIKTYQLRGGDVLYIKILSPEPRLSSYFNTESENSNVQATPNNLYIKGYLVDDSGYVDLPVLGKINAHALTLDEFKASLKIKVDQMVSTATIIVKMASFKVTVLGEVVNPGLVYFTNERVSLLEALANAGDLTPFANRTKIFVMRTFIDGHIEKVELNMNDINIAYEPFFYLQPNDVIYANPNRTSVAKFNASSLTLLFASVSTLILILSFAARN